MSNIKTKNTIKGTIKTINKATVATEKTKYTFVSIKDKAENSVSSDTNNAEEYASDKFQNSIDKVVQNGSYAFDKAERKGLKITENNYRTAKDGTQHFKRQSVKQSSTSFGNKTIKFGGKDAKKATQKSIKTAEKTAKSTIKTSQQATKVAHKTTQATVKTTQKSVQAAKATAKITATTIKAATKATIAAVKAAIASVKSLVAAIAAGGWIAVVIIIIFCLIALIIGSVYGVFFSNEDSETGLTLKTAIQEIDFEYSDKINEIKNSITYDVIEMNDSKADWKEVLAVYAVKTNFDPNNPMEVATMDDTKKQLLKDIFWEMNEITSKTESKAETKISEAYDEHGNIVQNENIVTHIYMYITITSKSVEEMAAKYKFTQNQKDVLDDLLSDDNNQIWSSLLN